MSELSDGMVNEQYPVSIALPKDGQGHSEGYVDILSPEYARRNSVTQDTYVFVRQGDTLQFKYGSTDTTSTRSLLVKVKYSINEVGVPVGDGTATDNEIITISNVTRPMYIVAAVNLSAVLDEETNSDCCGIRSFNISMQEDGSITASVTGLEDAVRNMMHTVMRGSAASMVSGVSKAYRITARRKEGALVTWTAMSTVNDTFEKIPTSAVFKTIPSDIYDLHMSGVIARSMQNPLEAPDNLIYIRSSNIYGTDGWTVQEILDTLRIEAKVPAGFNYHVYQLSVSRGAPVISLLHNLLPIPGIVIERKTRVLDSDSIAGYYITLAKAHGHFKGTECNVVSSSETTTKYKTTVVGLPGEPRYIVASDAGTMSGPDITVEYNLIGGVFAITQSTTVVRTETNV